MSTDWRALCAELLEALDGWHKAVFETGTGWVRPDETYLIDRARAVLAAEADGPAVQSREPASVVGEPSDEELLELGQFHYVSCTLSDGTVVSPYVEDTDIRSEVLSFARAVLARWGHQPAPPEEEVGVLLRELRDAAFDLNGSDPAKAMLTRAADLLSQRHPTPVPVSERLPGPEDCDAEGRCWVWWKNGVRWVLDEWTHRELLDGPLSECVSHWLPATALPLPSGEVEHG